MAKRFPNLIHVTREKENDGTSYLTVREGGVFDVDVNGEPIALYKLVQTGKVEIRKSFVVKRRR